MQYAREHENCIENSRRNERRGPYCLEKREIYAMRARAIEMSWKIYAGEQVAPILRYCIDQREESPRAKLGGRNCRTRARQEVVPVALRGSWQAKARRHVVALAAL